MLLNKQDKFVHKTKTKRDARKALLEVLYSIESSAKKAYIAAFNNLSSDFPADAESLANPYLYESLFESRIDELELVENPRENPVLSLIETADFDWSGFGPIKYLATEGFFGVFYELTYPMFEELVSQGVINNDTALDLIEFVMDTEDTIGMDFVLIPEELAKVIQVNLPDDEQMPLFPFSEADPVDFFSKFNEKITTSYIKSKLNSKLKATLSGYSK